MKRAMIWCFTSITIKIILSPCPTCGQEEEFFASPLDQRRALIHPFKVLFLFQDGIDKTHKLLFKEAANFVNSKLGSILKGPILADIRFNRVKTSNNQCEPPTCANTTLPVRYAFPCVGSNGQLLAKNSDVPENAIQEVLVHNQNNYSLVVLLAIHGPNAPDYNCKHFELENKNRPLCRWFGPPAMGVACQWGDFRRPTHARMTFCKKPDEFALDQGELNTVLLHEIMHFVIGDMDFDGVAAKLITRPWHDDNGKPSNATFAIVSTPRVQESVQAYFQCDRLDGAEVPVRVYANGTLRPKWDHWSFRLFPEDILAPHSSFDERLSALTLSAVLDRGWYDVDMSKAELLPSLHFSANGCDLAIESCKELIKDARLRSDSLLDIWPICDRTAPISTRCSADGRLRLLCHQIEDYACYSLHSAACQEHHPYCHHATQQSHIFPTVDFDRGLDKICVTLTSFPGVPEKAFLSEYYMPPCIIRECRRQEKSIVLKFKTAIQCEFACTQAMADKLVEYVPSETCKIALGQTNATQKIQLICPDYGIICEGGRGVWPKSKLENNAHKDVTMTFVSFPLLFTNMLRHMYSYAH